VATTLIILNWPNWPIVSSLNVCLCFVWLIGGAWAPCPPLGYATDINKNKGDLKTRSFFLLLWLWATKPSKSVREPARIKWTRYLSMMMITNQHPKLTERKPVRRVGQKVSCKILSTSSSNTDRFSQFFHCHNLWKLAINWLLNIPFGLLCINTCNSHSYGRTHAAITGGTIMRCSGQLSSFKNGLFALDKIWPVIYPIGYLTGCLSNILCQKKKIAIIKTRKKQTRKIVGKFRYTPNQFEGVPEVDED